MKHTIILTLLIGLTALSACKKVLDVPNPNTFTAAEFWKTEADLQQGLTAAYNAFYKQGTWTRNIYTLMDGNGDDGTSLAGWTELQEWAKFKYTNYDFFEMGYKIWSDHYKAIFRANQVLDHVDKVTFSSDENKRRITGQAKFLRGLYYFYLEILWENIPLVLKTSQPSDAPKQSGPAEVWAQIESDLKDAADNLPDQWTGVDKGRATKGAALAYLGKAYMQQKKWQQAKDALSWLVEGDGRQYYDLIPNYGDNFTNANENNKESVFEIQFSEVYATGYDDDFSSTSNLGTQHAMNASPKGLGWNNIQARRWLIDYFKREQTIDGKNDIRLFTSIWYDARKNDFPDQPDSLVYGRSWTEDPTWGSQVFIRKYTSKLNGRDLEFYWNDINYRLIRYADVLLCYAEVLNELNHGPNVLAIQCLDRVRQRANLPLLINSTYYNGAAIEGDYTAFGKHLQIERGLELCLECVRWIDLKRWGLLDNQTGIDELKTRDPDFNNFVLNKSYRLPLPQSEVDNNPNLTQNTPY